MPIHSVVIDHANSSNIYLGAEIGVYTKPMNSNLWSLYNPLFPNTTVEELEIVYGSNTIKAATWGRGLWEYDLIGRGDFPSVITTRITDMPTDSFPKANVDQYITSVISYNSILSSVFAEWSINDDTITNIIPMINTQDSTWVSQNPIPNYPAGNRVYFKVFAVGNNNDSSETYKFMYTVRPDCYSVASATFAFSDVSCSGGNDGSAMITISAGFPPFTYLWSNGQTTQTVSNLSSGNYGCMVTDSFGCVLSGNVIISDPPNSLLFSTASNVSCSGGNDGSAMLSVTAGVPPFTYLWSNGQTTQSANNLLAGIYSCIVTDFNGCVIADSILITEPTPIIILDTITDIFCYGANDGSIDLTVSGGTPCLEIIQVGIDTVGSYESYLWYTWYMDGNTQITYLASELAAVGINPGDIMTGLAWSIVSQDGSASSIIMNNAQMKVNGTVMYSGNYQAVLGVNNFTFSTSMIYNGGDLVVEWCFDNDNYLWGNNYFESSMTTGTLSNYADYTTMSGCVDITANTARTYRPNAYISFNAPIAYAFNWSNGDLTEDISLLNSGPYSCIITDCEGCSVLSNFVVSQPNSPSSSTDTQTACNTYTWIDGNTYISSNNTAIYTTTNSNGCDSTITLDLTITGNPILTISQVGLDLSASVVGGSAPYTYQWNTTETTQQITPLMNGFYWCLLSEVNGCVSDTAFFEVINIVSAINEVINTNRELLKITNVLGQETPYRRNTPLFYIYDDGTVEKRIVIE